MEDRNKTERKEMREDKRLKIQQMCCDARAGLGLMGRRECDTFVV